MSMLESFINVSSHGKSKETKKGIYYDNLTKRDNIRKPAISSFLSFLLRDPDLKS